jgi:hypothetical protein
VLLAVFSKDGLERQLRKRHEQGVKIQSKELNGTILQPCVPTVVEYVR